MAVDEATIRERLSAVFGRQDFLEACRRRDAGAMVSVLMAGGITQGQVSARTGIPQSTLSQYRTGGHRAEFASTFEKFADGLSMPHALREALGLTGDARSRKPGPAAGGGLLADTFDLVQIAETVGRNGKRVKRRDLLSLAAGLGAAATLAPNGVLERLAYALAHPSEMNETIVREMEARSAGFHLLEETIAAPALLKGLTIQLREVATLLSGPADPDSELRRRLLVVAGESSVLAGWAASDAGDSGTARSFYDTASDAAREAGDPGIVACALAYRSYAPSVKGANGRARALLAEALEILPESRSPGTAAWINARHAEESAHLGDARQAAFSWGHAEEAYAVADTADDRSWTRFLDRNRFDSYRIATYSRTGRADEAQEMAASLLGRLAQPDRKKAVIIFEDIASAALSRGAVNEAANCARNGLAVMRETGFTMWLPRYSALAQALQRFQRQPAVRAYLEDFTATRNRLLSRD